MPSDPTPPEAPNGPSPASAPNDSTRPGWPATPGARWPKGCLIEDFGVHPTRPWLALACTNSAAELGAIVIVDVNTGALVSVTTTDSYVGWKGDEGLVLWDATGTRLATNLGTNGIAVLESGAIVGINHPDETRDSPVDYAWVDHRVYTDLGNLFDPEHSDDWARFQFDVVRPIHWSIEGLRWNPRIRAVVGTMYPGEEVDLAQSRLVAYAPDRDAFVYDRPLGDHLGLDWSSNARWLLTSERGARGGDTRAIVIDADDGREVRRILPKLGRTGRMSISDAGDVVVESGMRPSPVEEMVYATELCRVGAEPVELPSKARLVASAWSADARGLAVLDARARITLYDVGTAAELLEIDASPPAPPAGLPDWARPRDFGLGAALVWIGPTRLAVVDGYYVAVYSIDGSRVAQWVVPH